MVGRLHTQVYTTLCTTLGIPCPMYILWYIHPMYTLWYTPSVHPGVYTVCTPWGMRAMRRREAFLLPVNRENEAQRGLPAPC